MAALTKTLKDKENNTIYPITKASNVYLNDNATTVQSGLDNVALNINYGVLPSALSISDDDSFPVVIGNENKTIDYDLLAEAILNLLKTKTYALTDGQQNLVDAIKTAQADLNEIKSKAFLVLSTDDGE